MYGQYPTIALSGPDDASNRGVWVPTTALDQYGATLASWFGVGAGSLPSVFPNLANFQSQNLGFLGLALRVPAAIESLSTRRNRGHIRGQPQLGHVMDGSR